MKRSVHSLVAVAAALTLGAAIVQAAVSVGQPAPDFKVKDATGKEQSLAAYKGKFVVLEWTNPGCPFVKKHYDSANMPATQKAAEAKGAVWLTVSSTAPGGQDYKQPAELAAWLKEKGATPTAVLMDDDGKIGKAYGARTTPHMFVIDPSGKLVYAGAIDSKASANKEDVKGATNYVSVALNEAMAGKPVTKASSEPYGCSVKY
jgi:peroxiredoxin